MGEQNKDTLKIYGTEDYILFIHGTYKLSTEYLNPKLYNGISQINEQNQIKYENEIKKEIYICQGLIPVDSEEVVKDLKNRYTNMEDTIIILTSLTSRLKGKDMWMDKLEDEDYRFFEGKVINHICVERDLVLLVRVGSYIEFLEG